MGYAYAILWAVGIKTNERALKNCPQDYFKLERKLDNILWGCMLNALNVRKQLILKAFLSGYDVIY